MPDDRPDTRTTPSAANASAPRGGDSAITPPDPPIVPAATDAEAAGTPPDPATRSAAPDAGPRTPAARDTPPASARSRAPSVLWLALVAVVLVLLLLSLWSGS